MSEIPNLDDAVVGVDLATGSDVSVVNGEVVDTQPVLVDVNGDQPAEELPPVPTIVARLDFARLFEQLSESFWRLPREVRSIAVLAVGIVEDADRGNVLDINISLPPEFLAQVAENAQPDPEIVNGE